MSAHYVYRAFDSGARLLYVGCTNDVVRRLAQHRASSSWHPFMETFKVEGPFHRDVALEVEAAAIAGEHPFFNALPNHTAMVQANRVEATRLLDSLVDCERDDDWYVARNAIGRLIRDRFPVVDDEARLLWYRAQVSMAAELAS
jgi:hypothetical protein